MEKNIPIFNLEITNDLEDDVEVDVISLVDRPAIERSFLAFADDEYEVGMPHYTKDGVLWTGPTHEDSEGRLMTGMVHSEGSEYLYHIGEYEKYAESYTDYPESAKNNAQRALDWAEKNGWGECGTEVGKIRANQIAKGEPVSRETIGRISGFKRHQENKDVPYSEGCGGLMWDAWGGTSMIEWASNKLKKIDRQNFVIQDEDQQIISGPLMLADTPIYRNDHNGEYYVVFTKETIKKIAQRYFKKGYQANVNLMHDSGQSVEGVTMFESFISDKVRGIYPMKGFEDVPDGSWFGSFKVDNAEVWAEIKAGKVRGFSVEGQFNYRKTGDKKIEQLWQNVLNVLAQIA